MAKLSVSIDIAADPDTVFATITDLENAPERIEGIEKIEMLSEGPVGVGTKWRETRIMMKKEATEEMEITAFEPPSHYTVYSDSCGCDFHWTLTVTPQGDGSSLTMALDSKARTFVGKLMTPIGWLFSGFMKKCVLKDLQDIKAFVEKKPAG